MKKILLMLALFSAVVTANAQIATENSNAFDNVGAGITAGVSTPLDFNSVFPLNTNVGLKITKDITPVIGFQIEGLAVLNDNHFSDLKTAVKATNVGLNGALNLSNFFCGYKGTPRVFEVSTVAGLGWLHTWNTSENSLTAKTGFDFAFNLGKKKAHSLVLTPAVYWNLHKIDAIQFNKKGAQLALNLSYIYHFKTSNGTHHFKTYDVGAMISEIDRLNGALSECEKREPQVKIVEKIVETQAPVNTAAVVTKGEKWIVTFATASSTLTNEAKFILDQVGNDAIVDVVATASPDGSAEFNQKLSERRAAAVADYLTNRGVKVNSWEGKGVDPKTGRSAIVKTLQ
jgi:hypothetical protein